MCMCEGVTAELLLSTPEHAKQNGPVASGEDPRAALHAKAGQGRPAPHAVWATAWRPVVPATAPVAGGRLAAALSLEPPALKAPEERAAQARQTASPVAALLEAALSWEPPALEAPEERGAEALQTASPVAPLLEAAPWAAQPPMQAGWLVEAWAVEVVAGAQPAAVLPVSRAASGQEEDPAVVWAGTGAREPVSAWPCRGSTPAVLACLTPLLAKPKNRRPSRLS